MIFTRRKAIERQSSAQPTGDATASTTYATWVREYYYPSLVESVSQSLDQLHQATNWGITLISVGLVAVLTQFSFPSPEATIALIAVAALNQHFMNHALKGYLNVMRFSTIQKTILDELNASDTSLGRSRQKIVDYHVRWMSPLSRKSVFLKGYVELGFGYLLVVNLAMGLISLSQGGQPRNLLECFGLVGVFAALVIESVALNFSPYLRQVQVDRLARNQR